MIRPIRQIRQISPLFLAALALALALAPTAPAQPTPTPTNTSVTANKTTGVIVAPVDLATFKTANDLADASDTTAALAGKVPVTRTVNGLALSADITLTKSDVGLGNVDNTSDATKNAATATLTNKDLSAASNTYRAATTSATGAVELATSAESTTGTSSTLVPTVDGAARTAFTLAGYDLSQRNSAGPIPPAQLNEVFNLWFGDNQTALSINRPLYIGELRNLWRYTETLGDASYTAAPSFATKGTDTITVTGGITLTKFTSPGFYGTLYSQISGLGLTPFTVGEYYLLSCFVWSQNSIDLWPGWARGGSGVDANNCFERHYLPAGKLTRIWRLGRAIANNSLDMGSLGTVAFGSGARENINPQWMNNSNASGSSGGANGMTLFIGGFQIEKVTSDGKYGIAFMTDSTGNLQAGTTDLATSLEWPVMLGAHLRVHAFNRGVGGNTSADMVARWSSDITPLAARCKYVVIVCGLNDFPNGTSAATVLANVATMVASAVADGLIPIVATCTPRDTIAANPTYEAARQSFNTSIRNNYPLVLDLDAWLRDPWDATKLRPDFYGDGVHWNSSAAAKQMVAQLAAKKRVVGFPRPSPYQKIAATSSTRWDLSLYGGRKQIMGTNRAANTATLTSGTVTVSNTRITASSKVTLTRQAKNASSAIGQLTLGTITAGTSFVITALKSDGTTETGDASTVFFEIVEPTP